MKHMLAIVALVSASLLYSSAALSEERTAGVPDEYNQIKAFEFKGQKDECLVVAKNCIGGDDSVATRVERLNREIGKGAAVYTQEELKSLQDQLNWIYSESEEFSAGRI